MIKDNYHRASAMEFVFVQSMRPYINLDQGDADKCRTSDTYDHHNESFKIKALHIKKEGGSYQDQFTFRGGAADSRPTQPKRDDIGMMVARDTDLVNDDSSSYSDGDLDAIKKGMK